MSAPSDSAPRGSVHPAPFAVRLRKFAARPLARNVGKVLTGNLAGNAISMLAIAIYDRSLTRSHTIAEFGIFWTLQNVMMFIAQFADFGLNTTLVKYYQQYSRAGRKDWAEALMRHALWLRLGLLAAMITICMALAEPIARMLLKNSEYTVLVRIACAGAAGYALWMFCQAAMQAREQFGRFALLGTGNHVLRLIALVGLVAAGRATLGNAVWVMVLIPLAGVAAALLFWPGLFWSARMEPVQLKQATRDIFSFSKWIFISSLATTVIMRLDLLMLNVLAHDQGVQVTHFSRAMNYAQIFPQITAALSTVLLPRMASTRDPQEMRRMMGIFLRSIPLLGGATLMLMIAAEIWFPLFYHKQDHAALGAHVFCVLAAGMSLSIILNPLSFFFMAFDKPQWLTQMNLLQLILNVAVNLALIPLLGAIGAASGTLAVRAFAFIYLWIGYRKLLVLAENGAS